MRSSYCFAVICAGLALSLTGCDKIPTWGELTNQTPPPAATPVQPAVQTPVQAAPVQPVAPRGPTPDEVIAKFNGIRSGDVTDSAIAELTNLKEGADRVTQINADGSKVSKDAFVNIAKLTNLRQLRLNNTRIDDEACQQISKVSSLEVLAISDTMVSDAGIAAISNLQNLKQLELTRCKLSINGFNAIGSLPALESIVAMYTNMNDEGLNLVCNAKTLTRLTLAYNPFGDRGLASLAKLDSLEYLELAEVPINGAGLAAAVKGGGFKKLRHLGVYQCPLGPPAGPAISSMKELEELNLGSLVQLDDETLYKLLGGMKNLRTIVLSRCSSLNGEGLKGLQKSKTIEEILLDQCSGVGDNAVKYLKGLKTLKKLSIGGTSISAKAKTDLQIALPELEIR